MQRWLLIPMVVILAIRPLDAQDKKDKPTPGDEMIYKYLRAETDKLSKKFMDGAKNFEEWKEKRPRLHREYLDMLGLWPLPEKTPLQATKTGEVEAHGVIVEKVHFQSRPGLYVTANIYRPLHDGKKKLPAIVYVCGHSGRGRDGCKTAFQDHGFWFANNGYLCIILDTLQLGEIPGVHHGTYGRPWGHLKAWGVDDAEKMKNHNRFWWHSAGYTPAGVECWNGVRAIDYLVSRPDVDPDKIGVTGISGGGAATFWIAAADDRVKVAVPVSGMSDLQFYVKDKGVNGHCDCMFLYNTYQWDWTTIAALVAPRPMLFANSDNDPIFPMDANRRIIEKLRTCYKMYGVPDLVDEYVSKGGHDYREDLRVAIFRFFNKHLKGDTTSKVEDSAKYTPLKGRELRVFPEDNDIPKDALNHKIDEVFVPRAEVKLPEKEKFAEWKKEVVSMLRNQAFHYLPTEIPAGKPGRIKGEKEDDDILVLKTNEVLLVEVLVRENPVVLWVASAKGGDPAKIRYWAQQPGLLIFPTGSTLSQFSWTEKSPPNTTERSLMLLGQTKEANQVRDLISASKFLKEKSGKNHLAFGSGPAGILAAYAALFEPSIKEVVVIDPPRSHQEGPHFPGVLRVLDIPEALGLLAPTPLTIIGGKDRAFDRTEEIYRLAGAADKLVRK